MTEYREGNRHLQERIALLQREKDELFEQLKETEAALLARDIELAKQKSAPARGALPLTAAAIIGAGLLFAVVYFGLFAKTPSVVCPPPAADSAASPR